MRTTGGCGGFKANAVIFGINVAMRDMHEFAGIDINAVIVVIGMVPDMH